MTAEDLARAVQAVRRICRGPLSAEAREAVARLLSADRAEEARELDLRRRGGCGADFNEVILAGPFDGLEHPYCCPKCGVEGTYIAPLAEGP